MKYLIRTFLLPFFLLYVAAITLAIWKDLVRDYLKGGFCSAFPDTFDSHYTN